MYKFVKPRELSRNCGCTGIHRPIKTLSLIMYLLICYQNYPQQHCPVYTRTVNTDHIWPSRTRIRQPHVSNYDPCFQPCYQRHLRHQPWITVTNYGSDTNLVKTPGPGMQARRRLPSEARFHNYFTVFSNTDNSTCMLICGIMACNRSGWPSTPMLWNSALESNFANHGYETSTSQLVTLSSTFLGCYALSFCYFLSNGRRAYN